MANVRCPMCSKLNPPDAEACSYCGARLKPLRSPSGQPPAGSPAGKKPEDSDAPDWLSSLRSDEPAEQGGTPAEPGEADQEPDWLSRIRSRANTGLGDAQSGTEQSGAGSQGDTPDWMKDLSGTPGAPQESGTGWLRSLTGDQPEEPSSSSNVPQFQKEEPSQPVSDDDWLDKLTDWDAPKGRAPQAPEAWSAGQESTPPATPEPGPAEEDFSWLNSFAQDAGAPSSEPAAENDENYGLTGFLTSIDQPPADQPVSDEPLWTPPQEESLPPAESGGFGLTGLFSGIAGETDAESFEEEGAVGGFSEAGGIPDWLSGESTGAPEAPAAEISGETNFADWLQSLESGKHAGETPDTPLEDQGDGQPAWLTGQSFSETPVEPPAAQQEASSDLPPWLEGAEPLPPQMVTPEPERPSGEETGLPSWLAGFGESKPSVEEPQELREPEPGAEQGLPSWISMESGEVEAPAESVPPLEGLPDWFASFEQPSVEAEPAAPVEEQPAAEQASPAGDVPEWLRDFDTQAGTSVSMPPLIDSEGPLVPSPAMEGDQPFAVDLPDWLAEDAAARSPESADQPVEPVSEELAQADLPEWVKEMRPIESIIPGEVPMAEVDRHTERSGPLAGMNGILPAEEMATQYRKPPVYSVKLRVTEKQRSQGSQFETILAQETQPLLIPPQGKRVQGLLLRILIALLVIGVLFIPPFLGMEPLAMPMLSPGENEQMFDQIENGQIDGAPVLLAMDIDPAFYGEMRMAALPVIDHLMAKNAPIVVVSTRPTGPALADQLLREAAGRNAGFNFDQQAVILGFLPGDLISLLEFAQQPAFAAPATLAGERARDSAVLRNVRDITDFAQVIVITDTAETGRAWVEQVQPLMGDTPLMMVTSAQASPMMAPFVESDQIDGMVSGLLGGVMYAQRTQADTPAVGFLASYQIGVLLAFGLTLVGGLVSGGIALFKREDKDED